MAVRNEAIEGKEFNYKTDYSNQLVIQSENYEPRLNLETNHKVQSEKNKHQAVVYKIKGNKLLGTQGGYVVYNKNEILIESCNHEEIYFWRYFSKVRLFFQIKRSTRKKRKHLFLLEHQLDFNFWHLHAELIPQIAVILRSYFESNKDVKLTVITGQHFSEKYVGMLKLIFQDKIKIERNRGICYSAEYFYLTSTLYKREVRNNQKLQFRNFAFWSALDMFSKLNLPFESDSSKQDVLLISRQNAGSRRIINESEFVDHLINNGLSVRVIHLEEIPWIEQLNTLNSSKCIIATHGAHSANFLYLSLKLYIEIVSFDRKRGLNVVSDVIGICGFTQVPVYLFDVPQKDDFLENYYLDSKTIASIRINIKNQLNKCKTVE